MPKALHTDDIETVTMQMEWMTQIGLLHFIDQNDFDNSVQWNIYFVCTHTVGTAVSRSIIAVAKLLWIDVIILR